MLGFPFFLVYLHMGFSIHYGLYFALLCGHLANESLFIHTARILWASTLKCAQDENGVELLPDINAFVEVGLMR